MADGYDKSQDKVLWAHDGAYEDRFTRLSVAIHKYGEKGRPKAQISRENRNGDDWSFVKLGRMTAEEFEAVSVSVRAGFESVANPPRSGFPDSPITDDDVPF
jgi:hypothetical protein